MNIRLARENTSMPVDEISLYREAIPNLVINKAILSPLRHEKNPSFYVYKGKRDGSYRWYDHGTGEGGNVFSFLARFNNVDINIIKRKININKPEINDVNYEVKFKIIKAVNTSDHLSYFKQYFIDINYLNKYDVIFADLIYKKTDSGYYESNRSVPGKPIFAYLYNRIESNCFCIVNKICKDEQFYKIYFPMAKTRRFESNLRGLWVDGFRQLEYKSDMLIITKSRKDVICLDVLGFESISFNCETVNVDIEFIDILRGKYKKLYVLYDNDNAGIKGAIKLSERHRLNMIIIPNEYKTKDVSDTIKEYGVEKTKEIINDLIHNCRC